MIGNWLDEGDVITYSFTNVSDHKLIIKRRQKEKYREFSSERIVDGKVHARGNYKYAAWCISSGGKKIYRIASYSPPRWSGGKRDPSKPKLIIDYVVSPDGSKLMLHYHKRDDFSINGWDVKNSRIISIDKDPYVYRRE